MAMAIPAIPLPPALRCPVVYGTQKSNCMLETNPLCQSYYFTIFSLSGGKFFYFAFQDSKANVVIVLLWLFISHWCLPEQLVCQVYIYMNNYNNAMTSKGNCWQLMMVGSLERYFGWQYICTSHFVPCYLTSMTQADTNCSLLAEKCM